MIETQIVYKKSWLKTLFLFLLFLGFTLLWFAAALSNDFPSPWLAYILFSGTLLFNLYAIKSLIKNDKLVIDKHGVHFSGIIVSWDTIHKVTFFEAGSLKFSFYQIIIEYGEKTEKPLIYYFNKKKVRPTLKINSYYFNAPIAEIYKSIREKYHEFGDGPKLTEEERVYNGL